MRLVSEHNIAKVSFIYAIIVVGVMTFSTGALFIINKINSLHHDLELLEETFIREEKENLRTNVEALIARIDARRQNTHELLRQQLEERSLEALAITDNLWQTLETGLSPQEIAPVIVEALRPIRFNNGQSYYFIIDFDGKSVLHPIDPSVEGKSLLHGPLARQRQVAAGFLEIVNDRGSGYMSYEWPKPGEPPEKLFRKISHVTSFPPLRWVVGTGEYLDNLDNLAKTAITEDLRKNLQFYKNDYYFIYQLHDISGGNDFATMLINSNRPDLEGKTISDDYLDAKGKPFRKEFLQGIRQRGEEYVVYWYKKPDDSGIGRKLAFFKLYPEWQWVVARGIYFDRLDATIAAQKRDLADRVKKDIVILCLLFLVAVTIALLVAYRFSGELQTIFDRYRKNQQQSYEKLEAMHKTLKIQSRVDALTGLCNRGYFNTTLSVEMARAIRYSSPLGLLILDLDRFKSINDTFGHLRGDAVLQSFARLLRENIRKTDIAARWGGEEFVILAPGIDDAGTMLFAEKIRRLVEEHEFPVECGITCSIGVASLLPPESASTFLQRADDALYTAKRQGRNRCIAAQEHQLPRTRS